MTRPVPVRLDPEQGKHVKSMQRSGLCQHVSGSGKVMVYVSDSKKIQVQTEFHKCNGKE